MCFTVGILSAARTLGRRLKHGKQKIVITLIIFIDRGNSRFGFADHSDIL
jgi:hypothetical protein